MSCEICVIHLSCQLREPDTLTQIKRPMTLAEAPTLSTKCGDCPIRHRAVCSNCESEELAMLDDIKYYRRFEAGQTVVWSGDRMGFVASVVSGVATLTQTMDGRFAVVC